MGLAIATLLALAAAASAARAQDGGWWQPFGPANEGTNAANRAAQMTYDREFIREWEANPPKGYPTLSKRNVDATKAAIKRYEGIVAKGGWKPVPQVVLRGGTSDPAVALLRERLALSGDLKDSGSFSADYFDGEVEKAVKRFQAANGLTPTGVVDKRTTTALNVSASDRLRQLKINLSRLTEFVQPAGKRYVVVNVPSAQIEAVEGDKVVSRHAGVVGKPDRATPILRSSITSLNFNPVWTLPPTVIDKDLIPKGREMQRAGKNVLVKFGIDAYDGAGKKLDPEKINWSSETPKGLSYKQQPGKDNPLGFLKINFDSAQSVYMHDTPSETLFGRNVRAASSGCVRVHGIEHLALWLLAGQGWDEERVFKMKETRERQDVRLKHPVPLYFVYLTAWATEDGIIQFRRDLYQKDGVAAQASAY
jgi:murein L,D-transpeptidase YcbB/YkuD